MLPACLQVSSVQHLFNVLPRRSQIRSLSDFQEVSETYASSSPSCLLEEAAQSQMQAAAHKQAAHRAEGALPKALRSAVGLEAQRDL